MSTGHPEQPPGPRADRPAAPDGDTGRPGATIVAGPTVATVGPPPDGQRAPQETLTGYLRRWVQSVRAGDFGSLPIVVGLVVIAVVFGFLNDTFTTERNFTNLLLQTAPLATMAIGVVFVLLIGEIDLSVAFVSAVGGVVMTLLLRDGDPGWPSWLAIAVALLITTVIGLVQGLIVTKAGVPSFVVTLAGLLVFSGVVLFLMTDFSTSGTIRIEDSTVVGLANNFLSKAWGWVLGGAIVAGYALAQLRFARSQRVSGLAAKPVSMLALQVAGLAAVTFAAVWYANRDRGVPTVTLILIGFLVFWTFIAAKTRFGRHVYAVGGSAEAARRAGINVDRIKIMVFMIGGFMAGTGGILFASRLRSVATNTGGGDLLLNVIAAAVIGGTSLFGGTGRVVSALLGALVIGSIASGMNLLGLAQGTRFIITGLVLLAAVLIDALSKRRRAASGVV